VERKDASMLKLDAGDTSVDKRAKKECQRPRREVERGLEERKDEEEGKMRQRNINWTRRFMYAFSCVDQSYRGSVCQRCRDDQGMIDRPRPPGANP
jgi:hypothetical protein